MEERGLGGSGIRVSRLILGCGNFGGVGSAPEFFGRGESEEEAGRIMHAAVAAGITTFDTAASYGGGRSETWIGRWLGRQPPEIGERLRLSTKVYWSVAGDPDDHGLAPDRIRRELDGSLARLGRDRVDLYLTHEPAPETPIADTLEALDGLAEAARIGAFGASNVDGTLLAEALASSEQRGLRRYEWVQNSYSLLDRAAERDVLPLCREHGLGFTPFSPLAGGWLTGKYRRGEAPPAGSRMTLRPEPYAHLDDKRIYRGLDALAAEADRRAVDSPTLALAWVLSNPDVTAVVVGPRTPAHLEPARRALELELSADERDELAGLFEL